MSEAAQLLEPLPAHALIGRVREQETLHACLAAALARQARLVLISGEAGIGKTALATALCQEAERSGAQVAVGRAFDLSEPPPYGLWLDLFASYTPPPDAPTPPVFARPGTLWSVPTQAALFEQTLAFVKASGARRPLCILLEDVQWADSASLDLLRFLARSVAGLPVLLVVTYRADELRPSHALYHLVPALVREARAVRLDLRPLAVTDITALIHAQYPLDPADMEQLATHLYTRAQGNPFYTLELLQALETEGVLSVTGGRWRLAPLTDVRVPILLRQVIGERLARFAEETHRLLAIAAVIGQEAPLALWATIANVSEEQIQATIEQAADRAVLTETPDGARAQFTHALIREVLYEEILPSRRRRLHREIAETLAANSRPEADTISYHFRRAGDARAVDWLIRAGEWAQKAHAWLMAAARYEAALALLDSQGGDATTRGWLLYRIAILRRHNDPHGGVALLQEAWQTAGETGDTVLAAHARYYLGSLLCIDGDYARGLPHMEAGVEALEAIDRRDASLLEDLDPMRISLPRARHGLITWLTQVGRFADARAIAQRLAQTGPDIDNGLAMAHAMQGEITAARHAFAVREAESLVVDDHYLGGLLLLQCLVLLALPYEAENRAARDGIADQAVDAWTRANAMRADLPARFARVPLMAIEGEWDEAYALAVAAHPAVGGFRGYKAYACYVLGPLARARGEPERAWNLIAEWLPDGADAAPGHAIFFVATALQRLAAALAIDVGDLSTARRWLEAHDRWLAWSRALTGRAEGKLGWAEYHLAAGDEGHAMTAASDAVAIATTPRQSLALLAAHRALGILATRVRRFTEAAAAFTAALELATECAAPYERALTLLGRAELHAAEHDHRGARDDLTEASEILVGLRAAPALARAGAIAGMLDDAPITLPDGLTTREADVLRLIAAGKSNREIASLLSISSRTVDRHITNLYGKIDARGKADATAYALRHHLT